MINFKKEIYEGWTVANFILELCPIADMIMNNKGLRKPFKTKKEIATWCINEQPYYKKLIPEVVDYFCQRYGINS